MKHQPTGRTLRDLRTRFDGRAHIPGDDGYDTGRASWHRTVDAYPAVVVEAAGQADVRAAVRTAREHGLPFAVQATGHGTLAPADGGLLVKTSRLASVEVDAASHTAEVGPGALWSDVVSAAAPFGLAPLSGTASVGVTGYTLGGGAGFLSRTYGLAADSVVRVSVVTSEGDVVNASGDEHPELFWALRGGGGNFGVATSLEVLLHPVPRVYAGMSFHDARNTGATLRYYREWARAAPDELNTSIVVTRLPDSPHLPEPVRARPVLGIRAVCPAGTDARTRLQGLLETAGPPLMGGFTEQSYADASAALSGPPHPAMAVDQRFNLFHDLSGAVITAITDAVGGPVSAVEIRHWGGAIADPGAHAGPAGHRDVPFSVMPVAMAQRPDQLATIAPHLDDLETQLSSHATGGSFLNFLTDPARTETAYTAENYRRLADVKQIWDPDNLFRSGHNIPPACRLSGSVPEGVK